MSRNLRLSSVLVMLGAVLGLTTMAATNQFVMRYRGLSFTSTGVYFAQLATLLPQINGTQSYCLDCGVASNHNCTGGGSGSSAELINGVWICGLINAGVIGSVPDPMRLNTLHGIGVTPSISGMSGAWQNAINPMAYNVKADGRTVYDGAIVAAWPGTISISGSDRPFTSADVGKVIISIYCGSDSCAPVGPDFGSTIDIDTIASVQSGTAATLSHAYSGTGESNVFFYIGSDDTTAWQHVFNACGGAITTNLNPCVVLAPAKPSIITSKLLSVANAIDFIGSGAFAAPQVALGTGFIWAGAGGSPVLTIRNSGGSHWKGFYIIGSSLSANEPSACIDLDNTGAGPVPNAFNTIEDFSCNGYLAIWPDGGNVGGAGPPVNHLSTYGIEWTGRQDDRDHIVNNAVLYADTCWYQSDSQAVETTLDHVTCFGAGGPNPGEGGLYMSDGGDVRMDEPEMLGMSGSEYYVAGGGRLTVNNPQNENDNEKSGANTHQVLVCGAGGCEVTFNGRGLLEAGAGAVDVPTGLIFDLTGTQQNLLARSHGEWPGSSQRVRAGSFILPPLRLNPAMIPYEAGSNCTTGTGGQPVWSTENAPGETLTDGTCTWRATYTGVNNSYANITFNGIRFTGNSTVAPFVQPALVANPSCSNGRSPAIHLSFKDGASGYTLVSDSSNKVQVVLGTSKDKRWITQVTSDQFRSGSNIDGGSGDYVTRILQGTDALSWGIDLPGATTAYGNLAAQNLPSPGTAFQLKCNTSGSTTYYIKAASCADTAGRFCGLPGAEASIANCDAQANLGTTDWVEGTLFPIKGAASYAIYASTASGSEALVYVQPANVNWDKNVGGNSFRITRAVFGGSPNGSDQTGMVKAATAFDARKLSGALSVAAGAGHCQIFAVAGTNSGTCKLQAICGTGTRPVTLVDNIGSGC
jgi:hypothetical protein